jgi:hypothetical protein
MALLAFSALTACGPQAPAPAPEAAPEASAPAALKATITNPAAMSEVKSPFVVEGVAPNHWFHEAQFDARLVGTDGKDIAIAAARAQDDWMVEGPVTYKAEFTFSVKEDTPAMLIVEKWVSEGDVLDAEDRVEFPVTLKAK